jgi:hypothetical protein
VDLHHKKEVARAKVRKRGITVEEVARMNTGDHWHGTYVASVPEATALRPIEAEDGLVRRAIRTVTSSYPCLQLEHQQPTPEEYFVGHLWCVRVPGTPDNFEELITKCLRGMMTMRRKPASARAAH